MFLLIFVIKAEDVLNKFKILNKSTYLIERILFNILVIAISFLSSRIMVIRSFPFGISVVSSSKNLITSMIGSFLGYFSLKSTSTCVRYVSTVIAVFFVRLLFSDFKRVNNYILYSVIVNFIPNFIIGLASKIAYGLTFISFTECVLESFISMGLSCLLKFIFNLLSEKKEKFEVMILLFVFSIIFIPFMNVRIFYVNIMNVVFSCAILCSSYSLQILGGSICGILQGILYIIAKNESYVEIISSSFSGMMSGISSKFGKLFMCLVYLVSNLIIRFQINSEINHTEIIEKILGMFLFLWISEKMDLKHIETLDFFNLSKGTLSFSMQNISILNNCLIESKKEFNEASLKTNKSFKSDSKDIVNSYLDDMNQIFNNIAKFISEDIEINENISCRITEHIRKVFKVNTRVSYGINHFKKAIIQIEFYKFDVPYNLEKFGEEISFICGKSFMKPEFFISDSSTILRICEKANLRPCIISEQHTNKGEKYCGDSFNSFFDGLGNFYVIMCDGMGTGYSASISGNMSSKVISNMIRGGINPKTAISISNSFLIAKSNDETLSTVDIFSINLFSGESSFIKAGSASSFVKKRHEVIKISSDTFPIGILTNFNISTTRCKLGKDDLVLMVSDGITDTGEDWIEDMIKNEINIVNLNNKILKNACKLRKNINDDDITSILVKI